MNVTIEIQKSGRDITNSTAFFVSWESLSIKNYQAIEKR